MAYKDQDKKKANAKKHNAKHYANRTPAQKLVDLERARAYGLKNKAAQSALKRNWRLKTKYGITREEYDSMLQSQNNSCAICKSNSPGSPAGWHIDHCHTTGKVRGILCACCNVMLGLAKDNEYTLFEAMAYLLTHRGAPNVGR